MINHEFNEEKYEEIIKQGVVLFDFYATWCGPCKMLAPELEELVKKNKDVCVYKIDVDKHSNFTRKFGIMSVPTLILYKNGELVKKISGYMPCNELINWINN